MVSPGSSLQDRSLFLPQDPRFICSRNLSKSRRKPHHPKTPKEIPLRSRMTVEAKSESLHWNFSTTLQCRLEAQEDLSPGNASWGGPDTEFSFRRILLLCCTATPAASSDHFSNTIIGAVGLYTYCRYYSNLCKGSTCSFCMLQHGRPCEV